MSIESKKKAISKLKGRVFTKSWKKKISEANKGRKRNHPVWNKGKHYPQFGGKNHYNWKGGITPVNNKIRESIEYRLWREAVFARDNWTCQKTKVKGGKLHPHHIKGFAQFPELRFAINNGITLSENAHKAFHRKYGIKNNNEIQIQEFLLEMPL